MQPALPQDSTCPNCGGLLEKTPSGGLGCLSCLLRAGIGSEEETVHDSTPDAVEGGLRFGVYEIDCREDGSLYELGRGAMGVTYRATDTSLQRKVALKIIKTEIAARSADARERFVREARAAAALRHKNIATVYQFGMRLETGQYFYAMELIEGETLDERVHRVGPLDAGTTIEIAQQVTSALAAAEKHRLVHRDLKPANLMLVSPDSETSKYKKVLVKIIDFGLAKAFHTATDPKSLTHDRFVGTPAFASPEQIEHSTVDVRSDIYSLGETLWFALTGKTPFAGRTLSEIHDAQKANALPIEQLKAAHVPSGLRSLLESMLAFEPASRPGRHELAARLHRCSEKRSFFTELKRRNVYKVAVAYAVAAWLLIQAASILFPTFDAPPWLMQIFVVILVIGFPAALVFSWAFEITTEGIVRESEVEHGKPITRRTGRKIVAMTVVLAIFAAGLLIFQVLRARWTMAPRQSEAATAIPEKSIAVLPFENLSEDKANTFFADGVQDEILTGLTKVADLKVISRTSTLQYKSSARRNLREIAKALGVAHVLEGTVQRAGGRVRVNAQLIDARTDSQLWAERYDRDVADVFAIESELAGKIVAQLQAKISPSEKAAIEQKPTADLAAHDLYVRAKTLIATAVWSAPLQESLFEAVSLLNQAIERDPAFALAYHQLAHAHDLIYFAGLDHTPARLAMADAAIQSLTRLLPDSGEAHLALAKHLYWGYHDYDRARKELALAQKSLPNEPWAFVLAGYIDRRQGRWAESTKNLERAVELDPQNPHALQQISGSYYLLRRYADQERALDRAIAVAPKEAVLRAARAEIELDWHADTRPLLSVIEAIAAEDPREVKNIALAWLRGSLCKRDFDSALRALAALPVAGCYQQTIPFPRTWCEGVVAQMRGDKATAHAAFTSMRAEAVKLVAEQPDYPEGLCVLGLADAALGHKDDAIREGRRAVELLPVTKDSLVGALLVQNLALIYAWSGEKDLAFEQLTIAAKLPSYLSYGELRLHPNWDPLRGDSRFDKVVASLAPN